MTFGRWLLALSIVGSAEVGALAVPATAAEVCTRDKPQLIATPSVPLMKLGAEALRRRNATGRDVTVAVVDSGVDRRNRHLGNVVRAGKSFIPGDAGKGLTDDYGHGTAIAGIISAQRVTGSALLGLAPGARILPVRVFVGAGENVAPANRPRVDRIAAGIRWAATRADVINVSMSAPQGSPALAQAVAFAQDKGAVVVASVGNRTNQGTQTDTSVLPDGPRFPAAYPGVLGVTAANLGEQGVTYDSVGGKHVDVAAPGSRVLSTFRDADDCLLAAALSSTSFATGYASAAVALLREAYPDESPDTLIMRLTATASGALAGGRNDAQGFGLIRPLDALTVTLAPAAAPKAAQGAASKAPKQTQATTQSAAVTDGPRLVVAAVAVDPRADAREATAWWVALGAAGIALVTVLSGLATRKGRRT
ncbi:MAG: S8 family serine peptidase [Sporichthyaceae bacterium]